MMYVLAAGFAVLAGLYAVLDLSLGHWGSVAALAFVALCLVGIEFHRRTLEGLRRVVEGRP